MRSTQHVGTAQPQHLGGIDVNARADRIIEGMPEGSSSQSISAGARRRPSTRVSLLVRLWHDGDSECCQPSQVRAFVRNLQSGEEQYLDGMANVLGFVSASYAAGRPLDETSDNSL
jgi:hypothetical protein